MKKISILLVIAMFIAIFNVPVFATTITKAGDTLILTNGSKSVQPT